ncbi:unnamed protein product [Polarella glacialis]|uniref:Uncharacterized protein n=1 Tax=Polarella glacialis TaxID=89957 RepID=A0A813F8U1_POLGL|nr:unnamed protein product [Polarella glacialis]
MQHFYSAESLAASWESCSQLTAEERGQEPKPSLLYHLHIPRTAGISFCFDSAMILTGRRTEVISQEGCYVWSQLLNNTAFAGRVEGVAILFRDPRAHVLSQYLFCKGRERPWQYRQLMPMRFERWVAAWSRQDGEAFAGLHGDFAPEETWTQLGHTEMPFKCYSPLDLQTHHLSCAKPFLYDGRPDLEKAIANMKASFFVGIQELYQGSLCLLYEKVHKSIASWCNCTVPLVKRYGGHFLSLYNYETSRGRRATTSNYSQEVWDRVDSFTSADRVLYTAAKERFLGELSEIEWRYKMKTACWLLNVKKPDTFSA